MKPGNWKKWLNVAKKQLRQLGRTIDQEVGHVLERNLPNQTGRMVRIPVPVRSTPSKFPMKTILYRHFHQYVRNGAHKISRFDLNKGGRAKFLSQTPQQVSLFSSSCRVPRGAPRGLYTNWNMSSTRFANQRMYSTASINFTHEAVNNIAVSLRCLFSSLEDAVPAKKTSATRKYSKVDTHYHFPNKLSSRQISLVRDMELFELIEDHRRQSLMNGEETVGCYLEFDIPNLNIEKTIPSVTFLGAKILDDFNDEMFEMSQKLQYLETTLWKIHESYGSLPVVYEKSTNAIRLYFPNSTIGETEQLLTDLDITLGRVYPHEGSLAGAARRDCYGAFDSVLSNSNSTSDLGGNAYSSILSDFSDM